MDYVNVICTSEPDISYTRNRKLVVGEKYLAKPSRSQLKLINKTIDINCCDIYDMNKTYLGNYFIRDFVSIKKHRDKQLQDLLDEI
jgi:hypothetical protein